MPISNEIIRELKDIEFHAYNFVLYFKDGGSATAPYWWYPRLHDATPQQRDNWTISGAGRGIHWPDIDEDLSITGVLEARKMPGATAPVEAAE